MQILWLNTAAFIGLGLIALPIAVHLLVRQRTRTVPYPSLRFLRETALAAFRRRRVEDALLLVCRVALIATAVLALAGPIVHTASRAASYAQRIVRAQVRVNSSGSSSPSALAADAFRFASFSRANIADSIRDAWRWIDEQPAAGREIVFSGSFDIDSVAPSDLLVIPRDIGIRFIPEERSSQADGIVPVVQRRGEELVLIERRAQLATDSTRVIDGSVKPVPADRVRIVAGAKDQPLADAALRAALDAGVRWGASEERVVVVWEGAEAPAEAANVRIVRMPAPETPSHAATAIWKALEASIPIPVDEPVRITSEQLAAWSRPPGPPPLNAPPSDEGDRRWLWALVLLLLAVEHWLRRAGPQASVARQETRVA
jgi:hypothetical protein